MKFFQEIKSYVRFRFGIVCLILLSFQFYSFGQQIDTGKTKYPNIVKISLSSYTLYPNSFHLGYERVLTKNKSIYVFGGYNEFPLSLNLDLPNTKLSDARSKSGFSVGAEFRFYLSEENKYNAPHGIYLAPYISFYKFSATNTMTHTDSSGAQSSVNMTSQISLFNIGFELGYQFVVFKRFVIDAEMFGPSFTTYAFQASINGQLDGLDQNETLLAVLNALKAKFPLLSDLSTSKTVYKSGVASSKFPAIGFRYAINIGFMF
jgi:hypothetical protein